MLPIQLQNFTYFSLLKVVIFLWIIRNKSLSIILKLIIRLLPFQLYNFFFVFFIESSGFDYHEDIINRPGVAGAVL